MTVTVVVTTTVTAADDDIDNIDEDINEDYNTTLMTKRVRRPTTWRRLLGKMGIAWCV